LQVLGLVCSPRRGGNTERLVTEALAAIEALGVATDLVSVATLRIAPCTGCEACHDAGECVIRDDMDLLYSKMLASDGLVIGTPVYFWSATAQAKAIIDRTYALRYPARRLTGKVGGAIAVAGRRGCIQALSLINAFFLGQEMRVAGLGVAGYGNAVGEIEADTRAINDARELGRRVVELLR
jgi:multimeric flavodoxin WrbA